MDFSILLPNPGKSLSDRFNDLKKTGVMIEPYDGDLSDIVHIVDNITKGFYQDAFTYIPEGCGCNFDGGGRERIIARAFKTERCDLYSRAVNVAEDLNLPVFECFGEVSDYLKKARTHFEYELGLDLNQRNFIPFSAEIHLIEGVPKDFNGLDSKVHFFVLPGFKYAKQGFVQRIIDNSIYKKMCDLEENDNK